MESQLAHRVRFGWGPSAARALATGCDFVVVVDVLSFSTTVDIAVSRGASIIPHRFGDRGAAAYAESIGASFAGARSQPKSLSPTGMQAARSGDRIVLPSPNGAEVTLAAEEAATTLCGSLRNAASVAAAVPGTALVAVIAAGERWPDGTLRPAIEDLAGAAAVISRLGRGLSPAAKTAVRWLQAYRANLDLILRASISAFELIDRGYEADIDLAFAEDSSTAVPELVEGGFSGR